ncbi:MAG TPA: PspC domain-containing protein, partial [Terricaulis sp.]|nr:PspC domain-containing protein [Terricaulis sp.]
MERVVTINLNGNAYQLEEPAYDALRAYLARAEAALGANPDKAEIIRDLEQAIADKSAAHLGPGKTVVNAAEMARVLEEMGPVEGEAESEGAPRAEGAAYDGPRRRLYRIKDGANIAGISTGMAAFFDIDVNIIRLLWIVAALFTSGAAILVYIAMMFLVPSAHTSEEWAAAHGVPFNAQEVIDRAKREYSNVAENASKAWRRERRNWNR